MVLEETILKYALSLENVSVQDDEKMKILKRGEKIFLAVVPTHFHERSFHHYLFAILNVNALLRRLTLQALSVYRIIMVV